MSDIVERLRTDVVGNAETDETSLEAANEIERLRAALRRIAESPEADTILVLPEGDTVWKFAREALEQ